MTALYGNFKNYQIIKIHFDKNPKTKFLLSNGTEINYEEYYKKNYNIVISDIKQPLVEVPKPIDKKINKDLKIVEK